VASDFGFGETLDNVFQETLDKLFAEGVNSEFGASGSGFGVPLETDSCMDDLFSTNLYNNEMPDDQLLFETNIILDSTLESNFNQYDITGSKVIQIDPDQNSNDSTALSTEQNEFDPDTNLLLFLNDKTKQACLNLAGKQEQTVEEEHYTPQSIFMEDNSTNSVDMDEQLAFVEYVDEAILFGEEVETMEMDTGKTPNRKRSDNRHRKGPKQLSKDEIKDEDTWKNVKRCRDYRKNRTHKITVEKTELEKLEDQNSELKMQEKHLKEKVTKMKNLYIKLISDGRIKFG